MDTKKRPDVREATQVLLDRHGKGDSFRILFLLKKSLLYQWEQDCLRIRDKPVAVAAYWFLDSISEDLLLEVFGE